MGSTHLLKKQKCRDRREKVVETLQKAPVSKLFLHHFKLLYMFVKILVLTKLGRIIYGLI